MQAGYVTAPHPAPRLSSETAWQYAVGGPWGSPMTSSLYAGANFSREWELADF